MWAWWEAFGTHQDAPPHPIPPASPRIGCIYVMCPSSGNVAPKTQNAAACACVHGLDAPKPSCARCRAPLPPHTLPRHACPRHDWAKQADPPLTQPHRPLGAPCRFPNNLCNATSSPRQANTVDRPEGEDTTHAPRAPRRHRGGRARVHDSPAGWPHTSRRRLRC